MAVIENKNKHPCAHISTSCWENLTVLIFFTLSSQAPLVSVLPLNISTQESCQLPLGLLFPQIQGYWTNFPCSPTPTPNLLPPSSLVEALGWTGPYHAGYYGFMETISYSI